jgi:hypothetical protein
VPELDELWTRIELAVAAQATDMHTAEGGFERENKVADGNLMGESNEH